MKLIESERDIVAKWQRDIALRRAREEEAYERETEIGIAPDQDDLDAHQGNGPKNPKLRITCPECGERQTLSLPRGVTLDEAEGEAEEEPGIRTIDGECRSCEAAFEVAPPDGYQFSYVPNNFKAGEAAMIAFRRSYEGRSDAADAAPDAISCFREAYKHARRAASESALPPQ